MNDELTVGLNFALHGKLGQGDAAAIIFAPAQDEEPTRTANAGIATDLARIKDPAAVVLRRIRQTLGDVLEGVPYLWLVGWALITYKYKVGSSTKTRACYEALVRKGARPPQSPEDRLAVAVLGPRRASSRPMSSMNTRSIVFTKTDLLAPRSMTAIAGRLINRERLAEWV